MVGKNVEAAAGVRCLLLGCVAVAASWTSLVAAQDRPDQPVFRSAVERVTVSATVRTERGRPVTDLGIDDFELLDSGEATRIAEFRDDPSPVEIALLVDFSGSMSVSAKRATAAANVGHLLSWLEPGDTVSLFGFDRDVHELHPPTTEPALVSTALERMDPWGATSLFDAIAETGRRVARGTTIGRRAIVAFTDGSDNASQLTPAEVSGIASAVDVPVYIVIVVSPLERAGRTTINDEKYEAMRLGTLGNLARWTGGEIYTALNPTMAADAARQIVTSLRHQYLLAFEPDDRPGWHPIEVRTRDEDLVVRTRSGYVVPDQPVNE